MDGMCWSWYETRGAGRGKGTVSAVIARTPHFNSKYDPIENDCLNSTRIACAGLGTEQRGLSQLDKESMCWSWYKTKGTVSTRQGKHVLILVRNKGDCLNSTRKACADLGTTKRACLNSTRTACADLGTKTKGLSQLDKDSMC